MKIMSDSDERLTQDQMLAKLEEMYPAPFKTKCLERIVTIIDIEVGYKRGELVARAKFSWWDAWRHLQKAEVECTCIEAMAKILEPKARPLEYTPDEGGAPV